jgi:hypothetical protein
MEEQVALVAHRMEVAEATGGGEEEEEALAVVAEAGPRTPSRLPRSSPTPRDIPGVVPSSAVSCAGLSSASSSSPLLVAKQATTCITILASAVAQ